MIRSLRLTAPLLAAVSLTTGLLTALAPRSAEATDRVSNKASGDWNTAADWTPNAIPNSTDELGIGATAGAGAVATSTMKIDGGNAQSNNLFIGGGNIGFGGSTGTGTLNVNANTNLWTTAAPTTARSISPAR